MLHECSSLLVVCCYVLQLWNLPWWSCSAGSCVDKNINEIDYIETVIKTVLAKFSVDRSKVRDKLQFVSIPTSIHDEPCTAKLMMDAFHAHEGQAPEAPVQP